MRRGHERKEDQNRREAKNGALRLMAKQIRKEQGNTGGNAIGNDIGDSIQHKIEEKNK